jgi:hypothetical protein
VGLHRADAWRFDIEELFMTKDEALKLALKALRFAGDDGYQNEVSQQAITAIKQARSAPVQKRPQNCGTGHCSCIECVMEPAPVQADAWPCVIAEADFEQATITLKMQCSDYKVGAGQHWLHTTSPAQRQWVGLTHGEYIEAEKAIWDVVSMDDTEKKANREFYKAIEAKLKEKNNG